MSNVKTSFTPRLQLVDARNAVEHAKWFKEFLKERGVTWHQASAIGKSFTLYEEWARMVAGQAPARTTREQAIVLGQEGTGWDFLVKALHRGGEPVWTAFGEYLRQRFKSDGVVFTKAVDEPSTNRNLVFEMTVAAICANACDGHVEKAEPDIRCLYNGEVRAIACKNMHSKKRFQQEDCVVDGADQVQEHALGRGYVLVNVAQLVPHEEFFPVRGPAPFANGDEFTKKMQAWGLCFTSDLFRSEPFKESLGRRPTLRSVIFVSPTIADVADAGMATTYWTTICPALSSDQSDRDFERALNTAFQSVRQHNF